MGWIKIKVDAACKHNSCFVGVGWVARDVTGKFLREHSNVIQGDMIPRMAEALSLQEALLWARTWRGNKCIFEFDSKLLVDAVNGNRGSLIFTRLLVNVVN